MQFIQIELNDLFRDLGLSQELLEILACRLNEKNRIRVNTKIAICRSREQKLLGYFTKEENLVYCNDMKRLLLELGIPNYQYNPHDWRLFIDYAKVSSKRVSLHSGNSYTSGPTGYSTAMKEQYKSVKIVL